jgi:O-antigen ligase
MGAENILTDHKVFEWPFGNPLNGPFIHRIGIIFFALAFLVLFSEINYKVTAIIFILLSIFFSLLTGHRVGNFSFIIIIATCCFWPKFDIKKSFVIIISFCIILALYFSYNVDKLDRYFFEIFNFTNSSLIQYIGQWKTGITVFFDNFIIGIGPTNVQNYLEASLIQNFDPYYNNEHPHNHYIQAFAETGFFGGIIYCLIIYNLIKEIYISIKKDLSTPVLILTQAAFISSICLFWPFANTYDLFGQQQNAFLWYCISIYLVITKTKDLKINFPQN